MGTVIISRAKPFQRGDESISIFVDGKAAGIMLNTDSMRLELPEGMHQLRPIVNGRRGKEYFVNVSGDKEISLKVEDPPRKTSSWEWIIFVMLFCFPFHRLGAYAVWIEVGVWIILTTIVLLIRVPQMRNPLRLEPA